MLAAYSERNAPLMATLGSVSSRASWCGRWSFACLSDERNIAQDEFTAINVREMAGRILRPSAGVSSEI